MDDCLKCQTSTATPAEPGASFGLGAGCFAKRYKTTEQLRMLDKLRSPMRYTMAGFYASAGIAHLIITDKFLPIVPEWVPFPRQTVLFSGLCEIAGAAALLTRRFRPVAGVMLALYAICVFPANIKHAVEAIDLSPIPNSWWYHAPRLILQPVLVWWALFCSEVIDWPFRVKSAKIP